MIKQNKNTINQNYPSRHFQNVFQASRYLLNEYLNGCLETLEITLKFRGAMTKPKLSYFIFLVNFLSAKPFICVERLALDYRVKATLLPQV